MTSANLLAGNQGVQGCWETSGNFCGACWKFQEKVPTGSVNSAQVWIESATNWGLHDIFEILRAIFVRVKIQKISYFSRNDQGLTDDQQSGQYKPTSTRGRWLYKQQCSFRGIPSIILYSTSTHFTGRKYHQERLFFSKIRPNTSKQGCIQRKAGQQISTHWSCNQLASAHAILHATIDGFSNTKRTHDQPQTQLIAPKRALVSRQVANLSHIHMHNYAHVHIEDFSNETAGFVRALPYICLRTWKSNG